MYKIIFVSVLIVVCSATELLAPTILEAAPIVKYAAPAITSYTYETRQVHPGPAIALAAPHIHAAPLALSGHLAAPYALPAAYPAHLGAPLYSSKLLSAPAVLSAPLVGPTVFAGPTLLGKTLLIKK